MRDVISRRNMEMLDVCAQNAFVFTSHGGIPTEALLIKLCTKVGMTNLYCKRYRQIP